MNVPFDWVGRFAIGLAILTALAMLFSCELIAFNPPGWCPASPEPVISGGFASPGRIVPSWYTWPLYGVLRSISFDVGEINAKTLAAVIAGAAFVAPLTLAFFNWSKTPARAWLVLLVLPPVIAGLGWFGVQGFRAAPSGVGLALTGVYFAVLWIAFPLLARRRAH